MKKNKHNELIARSIGDVYKSLKSHLPYAHDKSAEGKVFHQKCVKEYARLIKNLSKLWR